MKTFIYFLKQMFIPIMYLGMFALIDLAILSIDDNLIALKIVLLALCLAFYMVLIGLVAFKDGQTSIKVRTANDINRRQIIETGKDLPINYAEEYRVWKGFVSGLCVCIPLIICTIIHMALMGFNNVSVESNTNNVGGFIMGLLYMITFSFSRVNNAVSVASNMYYYSLISLPVIVLTMGICYMLGARKAQRQLDMIKRKQEYIHGVKH